MKKWNILYGVLFFGICLVPSLGMALNGTQESSENRTLAEFPSLVTEEGVNVNFLSDAGDYFQDHFGFRKELVTANAVLNGKALGVSTADGVIQGTDGWLYYKDSLGDYLGTELLSERGLFNIAHTLSMVQKNLEGKGIQFLFTVAPNKNTLYGENMPYYDSLVVTKENNLTRLKPLLEKEGVHYTDLKEAFLKEKEILYHKRDSHWNNKGAAMAAELLLNDLSKEHDSYKEEPYTVRRDFEGDLDKMLYPGALTLEDEIYYDKLMTFAYVGEVESNFDPKITTVNPVKSGSLVMYRDSFGNTLLPFFADAFANAYFSRGVPYQMSNDIAAQRGDTVIVERAERFLGNMAENPPVLEASLALPVGELQKEILEGAANVAMIRQGLFFQFSGSIPEAYLDTDTRIYLRFNGEMTYEAFPRTIILEDGSREDGGFVLYLSTDKLPEAENDLEILTEQNGVLTVVFQNRIKEEMIQ